MIGENVPLGRDERAADTIQDLHQRVAQLERSQSVVLTSSVTQSQIDAINAAITSNDGDIAANLAAIGLKVAKAGDIMSGTLDMGGNVINDVNEARFAYGSQTDPSMTWQSDQVTGWYGGAGSVYGTAAGVWVFGMLAGIGLRMRGDRRIYWDSGTLGARLRFWGDSDDYEIGMAWSTLYYNANGRHSFRNAAGVEVAGINTANGDVQAGTGSTGRLRVENVNGSAQFGPNGTAHSHFYTDRPQWYFDTSIAVDSGIVRSWNENLFLQCRGVTRIESRHVETNYAFMPNRTDLGTTGSNYWYQKTGLCIRTPNALAGSGDFASLAFWTQYGGDHHGILRVWDDQGDSISAVNAESTAYIALRASSFPTASSARFKTRIRKAREENGPLFSTVPGSRKQSRRQMRSLDLMLFDNIDPIHDKKWAGCKRHDTREECQAWTCPCQDPDRVTPITGKKYRDDEGARKRCSKCDAGRCRNADKVVKKQHNCGTNGDECNGTAERPCWFVEQNIDRVAPLAERVAEVYPKAADRLKDGTVEGIFQEVLTYEIMNETQHLGDDMDEMRSRLAREILARRRAERRADDADDRLARVEEFLGFNDEHRDRPTKPKRVPSKP